MHALGKKAGRYKRKLGGGGRATDLAYLQERQSLYYTLGLYFPIRRRGLQNYKNKFVEIVEIVEKLYIEIL